MRCVNIWLLVAVSVFAACAIRFAGQVREIGQQSADLVCFRSLLLDMVNHI